MGSKPVATTYQDYLRLDDDIRYEVLEGSLMMVPAPSWRHQDVLKRLFRALDRFVEGASLGVVQFAPLDVVLSDHNVTQPDLLFISKGRMDVIRERGVFGAPDLVVEVISPNEPARDRVAKRKIYAEHGVREYWIVDPVRKSVEVLTLRQKRFVVHGLFADPARIESPLWPALVLETREFL